MRLRVEPFVGESAEWDAFVLGSAWWSQFHLSGWRRVIAYSWGLRLWKRLPVVLATALGPRIVRGIQ